MGSQSGGPSTLLATCLVICWELWMTPSSTSSTTSRTSSTRLLSCCHAGLVPSRILSPRGNRFFREHQRIFLTGSLPRVEFPMAFLHLSHALLRVSSFSSVSCSRKSMYRWHLG